MDSTHNQPVASTSTLAEPDSLPRSTAEVETEHHELLEATTCHHQARSSNGSRLSTPEGFECGFSFDEDMSEQSPGDEPAVHTACANGEEKCHCSHCNFFEATEEQTTSVVGQDEHRCDQCNYMTHAAGQLIQHVKEVHMEAQGSSNEGNNSPSRSFKCIEDEPRGSFNVADSISQIDSASFHPTTSNSSTQRGRNVTTSKQKVHRCKQCDFTATTKNEFWAHARMHIKPEKRLECPQCQFVTEYKHHLEYHLRNHFGSKPFHCMECDYTCVNKSMLNSHMKSHTNIYQFRCADCEYVTKYCHSLKLHLRKRNHKPSAILRLDGTVDHDTSALLVIKKSGPKGSKPKPEPPKALVKPPRQPPPATQPASSNSSPVAYPLTRPTGVIPFWPARPPPPPPMMNIFRGVFAPWLNQHIFRAQYPECPPTYGEYNASNPASTPALGSTGFGQANMINGFDYKMSGLLNPHTFSARAMAPDTNTASKLQMAESRSLTMLPRTGESSYSDGNSVKAVTPSNLISGDMECPLDLSTPVATTSKKIQLPVSPNPSPLMSTPARPSPLATTSQNPIPQTANPVLAKKSARKRKAHKLDVLCLKLQKKADSDQEKKLPSPKGESDPDTPEANWSAYTEQDGTSRLTEQAPEQNNNTLSSPRYSLTDENPEERKSTSRIKPDPVGDAHGQFSCPYCEITFQNCIMYTVHMGYHGYSNPFKCNICGEETEDKVSFFLHIARVPHT